MDRKNALRLTSFPFIYRDVGEDFIFPETPYNMKYAPGSFKSKVHSNVIMLGAHILFGRSDFMSEAFCQFYLMAR